MFSSSFLLRQSCILLERQATSHAMTAVLGTDLILRCIAMLFFAADSNLSPGWTMMIMMYHLEWSFSWHLLRSCLYSRCSWRPVCTQMSPSALLLGWVQDCAKLAKVQGLADYLGEYSRENGLQSLEDPHVGGCGWLWMAVDGCGWLWMAVDGCGDFRDAFGGIFSNLFGVKFRGTNLAGDIMLWYGSVGRDLVMVADLMVILTMATKEVCIELIEVPC